MFSRLLPEDTAFFVCDIQGAFVKAIYAIDELISTTEFLLQVARQLNVPCLVTEQYPERLQHTVDALLPYIQASETHEVYPVYSKLDYTMFTEEVKEHMKTKLPHVKNVVITGLETHICVMQTCMDLVAAGYNVFVCVDAVSSRSPIDRKVALHRMQNCGVQLITTESIAFGMMGGKNHPCFKAISSLVKTKKLPECLDF